MLVMTPREVINCGINCSRVDPRRLVASTMMDCKEPMILALSSAGDG